MVENRQIFQEMDDIWGKISNLLKELKLIDQKIWSGKGDSEDFEKANKLQEEFGRLDDLRQQLKQQLSSQLES